VEASADQCSGDNDSLIDKLLAVATERDARRKCAARVVEGDLLVERRAAGTAIGDVGAAAAAGGEMDYGCHWRWGIRRFF
jgi:hypothetical protein